MQTHLVSKIMHQNIAGSSFTAIQYVYCFGPRRLLHTILQIYEYGQFLTLTFHLNWQQFVIYGYWAISCADKCFREKATGHMDIKYNDVHLDELPVPEKDEGVGIQGS